MLILLYAILSLVGLLILHELSHFVAAKWFGIEVKEFGLGYPPRLVSKRFKDTLYSLNLLPFGAFVDISQEDMKRRSLWQRFVVLAAGVISFWIFSFIIFTIIFMMGSPLQIDDTEIVPGAVVQILMVVEDSPAEEMGVLPGDIIASVNNEEISTSLEVQEIVSSSDEVELVILRKGDEVELIGSPEDGSLGVMLSRVAIKQWGFFDSVRLGFTETIDLTWIMLQELGKAIASIFTPVESSVELVGPVGIMGIVVEMGSLGTIYFLRTMGLISLNLAIINAFPLIPVSDGGKIGFLLLEKLMKRPLNEKVEEGINRFFFLLLLFIMVLVTFKDIIALR